MERDALVYVIDDDESMRESLRFMLESWGWDTQTYAVAETFLSAYSPNRHACLLLDLDLPGMSGTELQNELAARNIRLPIIVITGHERWPLVRRVKDAGAFAVLRKPFQADVLLRLIEQAIASDAVGVPEARTPRPP